MIIPWYKLYKIYNSGIFFIWFKNQPFEKFKKKKDNILEHGIYFKVKQTCHCLTRLKKSTKKLIIFSMF